MPSPLFDFFEMIAEELTVEESRVLSAQDFDAEGNDSSVIDELRMQLDAKSGEEAVREGVRRLQRHFQERCSQLPFSYDEASGRFRAVDKEYLLAVKEMRNIRGQGKASKCFELEVMRRMKLRVTGTLHRVGHPRDKERCRAAFNKYLTGLGFDGNVLLGQEKDGGLDILWELPIGGEACRPIVSIQCKNSVYRLVDGDVSCAAGVRSLNRHKRLMPTAHVACVLFNDYITDEILPKKAMQWVPLGLSDLGAPSEPRVEATAI